MDDQENHDKPEEVPAEPEAQSAEATTTQQPVTEAPPTNWAQPAQPSFASRNRHSLRIAAAAAIALVLVGGGAAGALALDHHDSDDSKTASAKQVTPPGKAGRNDKANANQAGRVVGAIKSIDGSKIVVGTANGKSTTVKTSDKTQVTTTHPGALSDVVVGDQILVSGSRTDATITATSIRDTGTDASTLPPAPKPLPGNGNGPRGQRGAIPGGDLTTGKISKIDNTTITLQASDGNTLTVNTSPSTTYVVTKSVHVSDLKVGQSVTVTGTPAKNGDVNAKRITEGQTPARNALPPRGNNKSHT